MYEYPRMKSIISILLIFCPFAILLASPKDSLRLELRDGKKLIVHRAVKGESLQQIAAKYGADEQLILSLNPMLQNEVKPGHLVRIPLNADKYGDVKVNPVKPISDSRLPLATTLPSPELSGEPSKKGQAKQEDDGADVEVRVSKETEILDSQKGNATPESSQTSSTQAKTADNPDLKDPTSAVSFQRKADATPDPQGGNMQKAPTVTNPGANNLNAQKTSEETLLNPTQKPLKAKINPADFQTYVVGNAQSVQQLAATLKQDPNYLKSINDLSSDRLWKGQHLLIPKGAAPVQQQERLTAAQKTERRDSSANAIKNAWAQVKADEPFQNKETEQAEPSSTSPAQSNSLTGNTGSSSASANATTEDENGLVDKSGKEPVPAEPQKQDPADIGLARRRYNTSIQTGQHAVEDRELDTSLVSHYDGIDKMGLRFKNDFALYENNAVTYSAVDFRDQRLVVDEWAVDAADSNALYIQPSANRSGKGDKNTTHVVKEGETLLSIAKKYGVTQSDIINWNGLLKYRLRVGQELVVNDARGSLAYYERALTQKQKAVKNLEVDGITDQGLAYYDPKKKLKGVLMNNLPKGKWVEIQSLEKFLKITVQVAGPLPQNAPKDCLLMLDEKTATALETNNKQTIVKISFGKVDNE